MNIEEIFNIDLNKNIVDIRDMNLQELIVMDMLDNGYDPTNETDIEKFWKERLE